VAGQNKRITHENRHTILCDSHDREARSLHKRQAANTGIKLQILFKYIFQYQVDRMNSN